jgi:hypothetical protein
VSVAERVAAVWRLLAFVGRYGHQSVDALLRMTIADLAAFSLALQELMNKEGDPLRERIAAGG